jgi:uncharacterized protein YdcH (DUF465 family)
MLRIGLRVKGAASGAVEKTMGTTTGWNTIEKSFKYIRRWMGKNGKWQYLYPNDLLKPIAALKRLFGLEEKRVSDEYEKKDIKKNYGADKKTFADHVIEYLSNRLKWDNIFRVKENREKYEKPVKQKDVAASAAVEKINDDGGPSLFKEKAPPKAEIINRSLMRKVWGIYNPKKELDGSEESADNKDKEAENGKDSIGTGSGKLPPGTPEVRGGGSENAGDLDVHSPEKADNQGEPGGTSDQPGGGVGGNLRGRRGRSSIKDLRERIKKLLSEKADNEFTDEDKELLRQYEGGGGLAEKGATTHGTLYEFYTPQKVVDKVWSLVDKYNPRTDKAVIEPSAGTGRFAEGRQEKFNLFELDETSARIAGILHPEAEIKQGYFQDLFMNGRTPKKVYDGKKYDVAIGNPPYGEYSGMHRGLGEGKGHTRIEEYFIDRSLDTLKDGGILAMVVPSGFLRGKNSKAKTAIAKKAKLLEAWRLPNGTFGTTGIGTDIIVLRKESGDVADYQNDVYFQKNEDHIAGVEAEKLGRFGMEKYVSPPDGIGFDEALDMIDPAMVIYTPEGNTLEAAAAEDVKVSEVEEHENRSRAMTGNDNAAGSRGGEQEDKKRKKRDRDAYTPSTGKNMTADEYNAKYGVIVNKDDMPVWAATEYDGRIDAARLSAKDRKHMETSGNFTHEAAGNWFSIANYASGNIYEKLDQLEQEKEALGPERYKINKALLEAVLPPPKTAENIHISPISDFAKEYYITDDEENQVNLRDAFKQWAQVRNYRWGRKTREEWDSDTSPISEYEIPPNISFNDVMAYIRQEPQKTDKATGDLDSDTARMEAAKKREARRECAERLFNRFIREGLSDDRRKKLVEVWNKRYNSVVNPDYRKIPTFVDGMNTHKGEKVFSLVDKQVSGISFGCNKGNGILAHEVGVGKTVQGQAIAVSQIKTGRSKRPLTCVPKAVYSKWIKEYHQHFPNMVINELGNFSDKDIAKFKAGDGLNIPEGTISVCTYEALQKVTFKDETISMDLIDDMMDSQTIYDAGAQEKRTPKQLAEDREKMMERLGKGAKAREGALFWEDLGFDCIIVDEIHGFKNVFGQTKAFSVSNKDPEDKERQSNEFRGLTGGESDRAMKLFAIAQLIQKQNNGRNVFGLSATPFTNSPIEVYNMLSLVARNKLKELHIYNMYEFLAEFAEIKTEWSVNAKGEIVEKEVMKNWKNLGALQNLITEYMDYVTADEAGVIRPIKKLHLPQIELTPMQRAIIAAETDYMTNADPKEDPGATLKAINNMRMATLSPAAINPSRYEYYRGFAGWPKDQSKEPKPEEFVTSSPKLKFVCESVAQAYKQLPDAGQIIYLPRGVNDFVHVKDFLIKQGMPEGAIAFMSSKTTLDEKERIKNDFNSKEGKIKVIIGSETIKEGVSLNGNTTTIYNCMLGWNPTEPTQVEGRAWRQGNEQGHVHVVYPLMADSIDSLMYQKYDEKASRINEIWSFKGDISNDVSDVNPETLKFDLIKDPAKKANLIVGQKRDKVKTERRIEEARYEILFKDQRNLKTAEESLPEYKHDMDRSEAAMLKRREDRDKAQKALEKLKKEKARPDRIVDASEELDRIKYQLEQANSIYRRDRKFWKEVQDDIDAYNAKFTKMGIRAGKVEDKLKEISANIQKLKDEEERINDSYSLELARAKKELESQRQKLPPLDQQIAENVRSIMGNLRPMEAVKKEILEKRTIKKSLVIMNNRLYLKVS